LEDRDVETGLYFADFSDRLKLAQVIVGAVSTISQRDLSHALGELAPNIEAFKARLAFNTFNVVRQRNAEQWL
jgi:hypothetical protein